MFDMFVHTSHTINTMLGGLRGSLAVRQPRDPSIGSKVMVIYVRTDQDVETEVALSVQPSTTAGEVVAFLCQQHGWVRPPRALSPMVFTHALGLQLGDPANVVLGVLVAKGAHSPGGARLPRSRLPRQTRAARGRSEHSPRMKLSSLMPLPHRR